MLAPSSLAAASLEAKVVQPAISAQLERFREALSQDAQPLCDHKALHFQPPGWPHPLTVIYPLRADGAGKVSQPPPILRHMSRQPAHPEAAGVDVVWMMQYRQHLRRCPVQSLEAIEEQLLPMRKQLHQLLGLPMDRPMLRMANARSFDDAAGEACGPVA